MNFLETTIVEHPFFQNMRAEHRTRLLANARRVMFGAGDTIFHEGEPARSLFLIQSGRVNLKWHTSSPVELKTETFKPGMVFGWSWLFSPFAWHATAEAAEPTQLIVLDGENLLSVSEQDPAFGYALMERITQILIRRLLSTRTSVLNVTEAFPDFG